MPELNLELLPERSKANQNRQIAFQVVGGISLCLGVFHLQQFWLGCLALPLVGILGTAAEFWYFFLLVAMLTTIGVSMVLAGVGMMNVRRWGTGMLMMAGTMTGLMASLILFLSQAKIDEFLKNPLIMGYLAYFVLAVIVNLVDSKKE